MVTIAPHRMRTSPLQHCASQFNSELKSTVNILAELRKYRIEIRSGRYVYLDIRKIESFVCLYFLKTHLSWEAFLESTFVRYMCGHSSPSGISPTLLGSRQTCINDAQITILNRRNFLSWSPDETISRAQTFFNTGTPYSSAISTARHELKNIYIIRNRIAHMSGYAQQNFRNVVRSEIGYNPRGMTPGRFLIMKKRISSRKRITYLEYYLDILQTLCSQIVS